MSILATILESKKKEVAERKSRVSSKDLEKTGFFARNCHALSTSLVQPASTGIIAEFKRKSPSKGVINDALTVEEVTQAYVASGAACLSVLTDYPFFGGTDQDFELARRANPNTPILRKDFMVDEYQIIEAKAMGADVILLIAAALNPDEIKHLGNLARSLGMETLLEVHDEQELDRSLGDFISIVGVNNRNLKNFSEQNVETSKRLAERIPQSFIKVSESCISGPKTISELREYGYRGFLIGESFMKTDAPGKALLEFLNQE
ncbi:indole-3-glycerol phosphate synthase TrpC [Aquirufa rosea]|uniref:indole-3-glycerol-phosphate synthase n=1 Tax=Aquirufa rosea TaxID=2509241 RepID=A0A4V1M5N3_9BACT|nr:indole-3-glycerol phosphate synthase TrpC [Aquirufa rosea]RXK51001.1 indole-3-glycerol phosphate synthase TrpC [Aquirufa rosea]